MKEILPELKAVQQKHRTETSDIYSDIRVLASGSNVTYRPSIQRTLASRSQIHDYSTKKSISPKIVKLASDFESRMTEFCIQAHQNNYRMKSNFYDNNSKIKRQQDRILNELDSIKPLKARKKSVIPYSSKMINIVKNKKGNHGFST